MTTDRRCACLLTSMALLMSTGCQAITTIFETGVWVGVILVLVVLAVLAFVVNKFRGKGGTPSGTVAIVGGMLLLGPTLTAAPRSDAQPSSVPAAEQAQAGDRQPGGEQALEDVLLQGCVARDDGWRPAPRSQAGNPTRGATSPAEDRGEMFVLRDARRMGADAGDVSAKEADGRGQIYRLLPRSGVSLSTFEGQQTEVRGRVRNADAPDVTASAMDHSNSQSVQGGQMQDVGQTMSAGQRGRSGQSTVPPDDARTQAESTGHAADGYAMVVVTSVRMLAPTCQRVQ